MVEQKAYQKQWRENNKEKIKEYQDKRYIRDREKILAYKRQYFLTHRDQINAYNRRYYMNKKLEAFKILGNKCVRCGTNDIRILQIDHIYGGGSKELRKIGTDGVYKKIIQNPEEAKKIYQCLCANYNRIKGAELHEEAV